MNRIRRGWRLAKASWGVLRTDRSLAVFPVASIASAVVAFNLVFWSGAAVAAAIDVDLLVLPFLIAGAYAAIFCAVSCNVALAGAARLSLDGRDTTFSDGWAVARRRRRVIAQWSLVQLAVGALAALLESGSGGGAAKGLIANVVGGLAGVAWAVATFFVVPVLALEGLGPRDALKRSTGLVREHWGEGLVGSAAIGLAVFLVALVPVAGLFAAGFALEPVSPALATIVYLLAFTGLVAASALGSTLSTIFRVDLYRSALENRPPLERFSAQDVDAFRGLPAQP